MKYSSKQYFYLIWQYLAYRTVKKKNLRLDVIHCYSLSDFRFPGFWSNMKGAYTIFGPVGGGQRCPKALIRYDDKSHYLRDANVLVDVPLDNNLQKLEILQRSNHIPTILCMGRLINKKGFLFFIDVLEKLPRELPFKVMIYGEGPQKDLIEKKINLSNVKNKIQLKGYVKHEDVRKIYE